MGRTSWTSAAIAAAGFIAFVLAGCGQMPGSSGTSHQSSKGTTKAHVAAQKTTPPTTVDTYGNKACVLPAADMAAILGQPVDAVAVYRGNAQQQAQNTPTTHYCLFGAHKIGKKYLYFADLELACGTDGRYSDSSPGTESKGGGVYWTDGGVRGGIWFAQIHGCTLSMGLASKQWDDIPNGPAITTAFQHAVAASS